MRERSACMVAWVGLMFAFCSRIQEASSFGGYAREGMAKHIKEMNNDMDGVFAACSWQSGI